MNSRFSFVAKFFTSIRIPFILVLFFAFSLHTLSNTTVANAQVDAITNPQPAEAITADQAMATISTVYNLYCGYQEFVKGGGQCELNANMWQLSSVMQNLVYNNITMHVCDKTAQEMLDIANSGSGAPTCVDPSQTWTATTFRNLKEGEYVRVPSGIGQISTNALAFLSSPESAPIPTNLALYVDDTLENTIFTTPAYAQTGVFGNSFQKFVLEAWKITRNISLALFGAALAVVGVMIMFRTKISPQLTVSIYSVLPYIPLGLGVILLSYPLLSLAYSMIAPLVWTATQIGFSLIQKIMGDSTINSMWALVAGALNGVFGIIGAGSAYGLGMMLLAIASLVAIVVVVISTIFSFLKIFVSLMTTTILAPFVGLLTVLPGKQGLAMNLVKRILADTLALPLLVLLVTIGFGIVAYTPSTIPADFVPGFGLISSWATFFFFIFKAGIGIGIIWKARKARPMIEGALGVQPLFGGGDSGPGGKRK